MFRTIPYALAAIVMLFAFIPAHAAVEIGKAAPEIAMKDVHGNDFKLSDHKGKIVVLEWSNHQCPYVIKHYDSGNMQKLQKEARALGDVEWITIVSSAEGRQGHLSPEEAKKIKMDTDADPTTKLLDVSGEIGKTYGAKTTPHMYVINAEGNIAYMGAIDSNSSPRASSIEGATNYVMEAVTALKNGEAVKTSSTAPYGCSVKYAF